jgi:RNA polymerase sigma factor (TIGR02999 family)
MTDVTRILNQIEQGDPKASDKLLPLVYQELRRLARQRMADEKPGQTLQATALVHEAYLRLVDTQKVQHWNSRGHFFAAAAEAMRRILIENARRKQREKHGGRWNRVELEDMPVAGSMLPEDLLALSDAIEELAAHDRSAADLVKLRCFIGMSVEEAADNLNLSRSNAYRQWTYAKAWLFNQLHDSSSSV